jgi:signal peptidase I
VISARWLTGLAVDSVLLLAVVAARRCLVLVSVRGDSMRPTYSAGDVLLGVRTTAARRGRVIVFRPPYLSRDRNDPPYRVKRVVAVSGDPTPEWVAAQPPGGRVPAGHVVVHGDADRSEDSRHYGFINRADILAVVIGRLRAA